VNRKNSYLKRLVAGTGLPVPTDNKPTFLTKLTLDQIRHGLQQIFPSLTPDLSRLKILNDGFSSYVVLVADEFILRIAKHTDAMAGHLKEQDLLPLLQKHLPFQVPQPIWRAGPSDFFPFGVVGSRRIAGIPFSLNLVPHVKLNGIAQDLARFLAALHKIPLTEMFALGLKAPDEPESLRAAVMPTLQTYLAEEEYEKIALWWERYLSSQVRDSYTPRLTHGDPWGENIILNETLTGVGGIVDFETAGIGDVAQDFAAQKYLGADFLNQVLEHYQKFGGALDHHFDMRLRGWSMLRELRGLGYAIKYPGSGELFDSIQKVRHELSVSA
jgi:aminoglycoside 2''-phosphotransferase